MIESYFHDIKSFLKRNFFQKPLQNYKYFRLTFIFLSLIFLFGILSCNLQNREIFNDINLTNVFEGFLKNDNQNEVLFSQFKDKQGIEQNFINIKAMLMGIIIGIAIFSIKKGGIGISLGTFIGGAIGIWIATSFPSIIYFLELLCRKIWKIS